VIRAPYIALALAFTALAADPRGSEDLDEHDLLGLRQEAKARVTDIEQHLNDWDLDSAKSELKALEALVPIDLEAVHYFKGRIAFEEGRYDEAVTELEKSNPTDKPGSYIRLAKDAQDITKKYVKHESDHFVFLSPPGKDELLAPYALDALEKQRAALESDLGWASKDKVRIEILSNYAELSKESTLPKDSIKTTGTIAICKFNKLMVTSPKALLHGYDWVDTLAHEYTHYVIAKKSRNSVPIWMHEGLAKYLESRWRGPPGGAMTPSMLALLGKRVRENKLVPFEKMHPSMALLPTAEDASCAFSEVFFAIDLLNKSKGTGALSTMLSAMAKGSSDKQAVELAFGQPWPAFAKAWMAHLKKQPYPAELVPPSSDEKKEVADKNKQQKKPREISFGDFREIAEEEPRKQAHLGELLRERNRLTSAAEEYGKAYDKVKNRYESLSNKYALSLMELKRLDEAQKVLEGSLVMHPGSATTHVYLGRLALLKKDWARAKSEYNEALAVDPFNPEVHLALYRAADALKATPEADRSKHAASVLLGVPEEKVGAIAAGMLGENPVEVSVPPPAAETAPADAGMPSVQQKNPANAPKVR
jgi:tetratricopeptide (TPR) repeat protein